MAMSKKAAGKLPEGTRSSTNPTTGASLLASSSSEDPGLVASSSEAPLSTTPSAIPGNANAGTDAFGLTILHEPKQEATPSRPTVELIFVHGLDGGSWRTWTSTSTGAFWPDWLRNHEGFENVRIASFGYDANYSVISARIQLGIPEFANQLLDELDLHYFRKKEAVIISFIHEC